MRSSDWSFNRINFRIVDAGDAYMSVVADLHLFLSDCKFDMIAMSTTLKDNVGPKEISQSKKKVPFTHAEKEYLIQLVMRHPIIEDKATNANNIQKKKAVWCEIAKKYNSQQFTLKRTDFQLKRCWENMKTQRKKELAAERKSVTKTGGGPADQPPPTNPIDLACPYIDLCVPGVIDSNTIVEIDELTEIIHDEAYEQTRSKTFEKQGKVKRNVGAMSRTTKDDNLSKIKTEAEARLKRLLKLMKYEEELHAIKKKREELMTEREEILLIQAKEELEYKRAKQSSQSSG